MFSGVVLISHCSEGWSGVHIVQRGDMEFTLFSGAVCSSHCSVGGQEFKLFSGMVWSLHCSVVWGLRCCVKDRVEDGVKTNGEV